MTDQYFGLGCSNGNCCIRNNKGGMQTNGRCKCLRYAEEAERVKKLIAVARAAQDLYDAIPSGYLGNYQDDFHAWLGKALKELKG